MHAITLVRCHHIAYGKAWAVDGARYEQVILRHVHVAHHPSPSLYLEMAVFLSDVALSLSTHPSDRCLQDFELLAAATLV